MYCRFFLLFRTLLHNTHCALTGLDSLAAFNEKPFFSRTKMDHSSGRGVMEVDGTVVGVGRGRGGVVAQEATSSVGHEPGVSTNDVAMTLARAAARNARTEAGAEIVHAEAGASVRGTQAQAEGHVAARDAQAQAAVVEARARAEVDRLAAQAASAVHDARTSERVAAERGHHEGEVARLQAQLALAQERARLEAEATARVNAAERQAEMAQAAAAAATAHGTTTAAPTNRAAVELQALREQVVVEREAAALRKELQELQGNGRSPLVGRGAAGCDEADSESGAGEAGAGGVLAGGLSSLDVDAWVGQSPQTLAIIHGQQRAWYAGLCSVRQGAALRPQAHEAESRLRDLNTITTALPFLSTPKDSEEVLLRLAKDAIARLEVLREGVLGSGWASAEAMEEEHFGAPRVPHFLQGMMRKKGKGSGSHNSNSINNTSTGNRHNSNTNNNNNNNNRSGNHNDRRGTRQRRQ